MKCIVSAAALVFAVAWTASGTTPAWAQITTADRPGEQSAPFKPSDIAPNPQIEVGYVEPRNPAYRPLYEKLKHAACSRTCGRSCRRCAFPARSR